MFPNDLFVIDAYKAKVLKISNDVSSEIFDLEKEVGIVNPKDTTPKEENPVETITGHGKKDPFAGKPGYSSITVSQDKVSLFITNRNNGYLYHYKKNVGEGKYTLFQKVKVGKQPVACCEDPNGNIYVANYGDNTVSKVEIPSYKNTSATENEDLQDKVVKNIAVAAGPKSLVSDEEGTIWVACYLSHKIDPKTGADLGGIVNKIVNTTVVDSINVGSNPAAITCDTSNTIWVANSGSNTVSRILKSKKVVDFEVGARPVALVNDSYGNVIVANYDGNTVTIIETSSKAIKEGNNITTIPVGKGPNAIDVNMDDDVYVVCGLENTIHKISGKQVVSVVEVCDSPVAFGDFSGCANYNAQNVMAKADKGTTEEKIQTALDKAKQSEDSVKEMSARVEHALEDVKTAKQAVEAKTEQITEAVTKAGNAEQKATANAESIEAIKTGKLETTVFESYKSATAEKIDAATQKATTNEENIGQLKTNKLDVTVFESYKTEADGKFATKAELAAAGTSGSGAGTGTASLTPADQAKINKIDGIETDVTSIKAVTDGLKDKTFVEESAFTAYKSEAEGKFATKDEITTSGTGNLSVADKAKINKIDDIETAANAAKTVTDTLKDKTFVEESALDAKFTEKLQPVTQDVTSKYNELKQSIESVSTAGLPENVKQDIQSAKDAAAKLNEFESKVTEAKNAADSINSVKADVAAAKAVTDSIKDKTFVEESTFDTYKSDADGKFATKVSLTEVKNVTDGLKDKTFVEESAFTAYKSEAEGKFATKAEVGAAGTGLSSADQAKIAKIDAIEAKADDAKSVTDTLKGKTFVEESAFNAYKVLAGDNFAGKTATEAGMRAFQQDLKSYQEADKETKKALQDMKAVTDSVKDKTFVEDSTFTSYKSEAEGKFATKAELTSAGTGLSSDDQAKIAKIDTIETTANAAKAVTDGLSGKTFVEEDTFDTYKSGADGKFATKAELTSNLSDLNNRFDRVETAANNANSLVKEFNKKSFVEEASFTTYKSEAEGKFATKTYLETKLNSAKEELATKAEVQAIHGLTEDDQTKLAKLDTINKEVDILNRMDAITLKLIKKDDSQSGKNIISFELGKIKNSVVIPSDFDFTGGSLNFDSTHKIKFTSIDGAKSVSAELDENSSTVHKVEVPSGRKFPLGDNSNIVKVTIPYNPSTEESGTDTSTFKEFEFYTSAIDLNDPNADNIFEDQKATVYYLPGAFPVSSRAANDGTYEQDDSLGYIPASAKFNDILNAYNSSGTSIMDSEVNINALKKNVEICNYGFGELKYKFKSNDFYLVENNLVANGTANTIIIAIPDEVSNLSLSSGDMPTLFINKQVQELHKYPEEKITSVKFKTGYGVYYFIANSPFIGKNIVEIDF